MRIDWGKLLLYMLALLVAQRVVFYVLAAMGLSGLTLIITFDLVVSFLFTYLYYPSFNRRYALKDPDFYKNWGIFMIVLLIFDML
ncbi:MAG: hypothetical protein E7184_01710 [Erysipelotrichaceae bacterium]|nr:hypothetical protein [Erysipelotrichaceae bacterium]